MQRCQHLHRPNSLSPPHTPTPTPTPSPPHTRAALQFAALVAAGNVTTASGLALRFAGNQALGGRRDVDVIPVAIPAGDATIFLLDGFVEPSAEVNEGDALWSCKCTISFCTVKCTVGPGR